MFAYLLTKSNPKNKNALETAYNKYYKQKVIRYFLSKFTKVTMSKSDGTI